MSTEVTELELLTPDAHKVFRAELDGQTLSTTTGNAGARGRSTTKTYKSEAEARKARDKAVAKKVSEGYWSGPWPMPAEVDERRVERGTTLQLVTLPQGRGRCPRVFDTLPKHLEIHRKTQGWTFVEGPRESHLWFPGRLCVGRGHTIRPVEPELRGSSYEQFPFMYSGWPFRPDGDAMLVAHHADLHELDIEAARATKIHTFHDFTSLRAARPMLYGADGREVLWRQGQVMFGARPGDEPRPMIEVTGEPIKDAVRLADGTIAVLQEGTLTRFEAKDGAYRAIQSLRLRKGFGLGTWLDGRVLVLLTRNTGPGCTLIYALHDGHLHPLHQSPRAIRQAFDLRGAQWMIEAAPGGDVDWEAHRVFNVEAAWAHARQHPALGDTVVLERPSAFDAMIAALDDRDPRGPEHVAATLDAGADLEARGLQGGWTPLIYAAWRGSMALTELLLARGADVNGVSREGRSALSVAFERGHLPVATCLIDAGAAGSLPPIVELEGKEVRTESPLVAAAGAGYLDAVQRLLAGGADPNATGHDGLTALARAASRQHLEVAQLLHARGGRARGRNPVASLDAVVNARSTALLGQVIAEFDDIMAQDGVAKILRGALLSLSVRSTERGVVDLLLSHGARDTSDEGLHRAIDADLPRAVQIMLEAGANAAAGYFTATSPSLHLHHAATLGRSEIVAALLDAGAPVDALDRKGITALRYAIARLPDDEVVRLLLERGASVERGESAWGPLHEAAWAGRLDLIQLLHERGADLDATTADGRTAATLATWNQKPEVLTWLLAHGAQIDAGEFTPLMTAATRNDVALLDLLLAAGADVTRKAAHPLGNDRTHRTAQEHAEHARAAATTARLAERAGAGFLTLQAALEADDLDAVRALLDAGHAPDGARGQTPPLFFARSLEALQLLLSAGAKVDATDPRGNTALLAHAGRKDDLAIARIDALLAAGADRAATGQDGTGALYRALAWGSPDVARHLIAVGCPVQHRGKRAFQPLHLAARHDLADLCALLIDHGAKVDAWATTVHGSDETPLHEAARHDAVNAARVLLARGADPGAHDGKKQNDDEGCYNPIHRAAEAGHFEVLVELLRHDRRGARYAQIARGSTVDDLAEDHPRCRELLHQTGPRLSVDAWLARRDAIARQAADAQQAGHLWIERVDERLPDRTGVAPDAVTRALNARDWVRSTPAGRALVLRYRGGLHEAAVGDEAGIHELPITIRAQSMPYHLGPDGARFLVSDGRAVYELDADARTARVALAAGALEGAIRDVGYTSDGLFVLTEQTLVHFPLDSDEPWWALPAATVKGVHPTGTALVALSLVGSPLRHALARFDRDGLRLVARWDSPLALVWSFRHPDHLEVVAYDRWNAPVQVFRLHNVEGATADGPPLDAAPGLGAIEALPHVLVKA